MLGYERSYIAECTDTKKLMAHVSVLFVITDTFSRKISTKIER